MEKHFLEDYCTLDDSSRVVWGKRFIAPSERKDSREIPGSYNIRRGIDAYVSSLYIPPNRFESLIFLRADNERINESIIYDFVKRNYEGKKVIACMHYSQYPSFISLEEKDILEFTSKDKRSVRRYPKFKKEIFNQADREAKLRSKEVRSALFKLKNWDVFVEALNKKEDFFYLKGIQYYIAGFY